MALFKVIEMPNGVTLRYHRIVRVDAVTNVHTVVEVQSYTSAAKREEESAALADGRPMDVYIEASFHVAPYVDGESLTCEGAYEWLKTLPQFEGAEDC